MMNKYTSSQYVSASARISKGQGYQGFLRKRVVRSFGQKGNLRRTKKNLKNLHFTTLAVKARKNTYGSYFTGAIKNHSHAVSHSYFAWRTGMIFPRLAIRFSLMQIALFWPKLLPVLFPHKP
jgi:hypothetical protein